MKITVTNSYGRECNYFAIGYNETLNLTATVSEGTEEQNTGGVTWRATVPSLITVTSNGSQSGNPAVQYGRVVANESSGNSYVIVEPVIQPAGVFVNKVVTVKVVPSVVHVNGISAVGTANVSVGTKQTVTLTAAVSPDNASNQRIGWEAPSNSAVSIIDKGDTSCTIKGVSVGNCTITAYSFDGNYTQTFNINVFESYIDAPIEEIVITPENPIITTGESVQLTATAYPLGSSTGKTFKWDSVSISQFPIAEVSDNGLVTGRRVGVDNVTARMSGTTGVTSVTVVNPPNSILVTEVSIYPESLNLALGQTAKVSATVSPSNATNKEIVWTTPQGAVTSIDQNGNVKATRVGSSRIIAESADGNAADWITVTVTDSPIPDPDPDPTPDPEPEPGQRTYWWGSVTDSLTINKGDSVTIKTVIKPQYTERYTPEWSAEVGENSSFWDHKPELGVAAFVVTGYAEGVKAYGLRILDTEAEGFPHTTEASDLAQATVYVTVVNSGDDPTPTPGPDPDDPTPTPDEPDEPDNTDYEDMAGVIKTLYHPTNNGTVTTAGTPELQEIFPVTATSAVYAPTEAAESIRGKNLDQILNGILTSLNNKQDRLVSGQNIKTINNISLLGSGNISIEGGGGGGGGSSILDQYLGFDAENNAVYVKGNYGFYSNSFISAGGVGSGGGGGGQGTGGNATSIMGIPISLSNLSDGEILYYDSNTNRWKNTSGAGTLPIASDSQLGGIKVGSGLTIDSNTGVLSVTGGSSSLPVASATQLGGVKVGSSLTINNEVLDINETNLRNGWMDLTTNQVVSTGALKRFVDGIALGASDSNTITYNSVNGEFVINGNVKVNGNFYATGAVTAGA